MVDRSNNVQSWHAKDKPTPFLLLSFTQWLCSSCFGPGENSGGGVSGGDVSGYGERGGDVSGDRSVSGDGDSGGDESGDEGSGSEISKSAKTRASRSPHIDLIEAKEDEDREIMQANMDAQRELAKKKKEDQPIADTRYLTRNDVAEAVRQIKANIEIDSDIMRKMEKEDPRLYGITVDKASGTTVQLKSRTGRVVAARRDGDGYLEFHVELDGKQRKSKGANKKINTRQLLESAVGEEVVRWEDEANRVGKALCAIYCLAYVPVYKFVTNDPKVKTVVNLWRATEFERWTTEKYLKPRLTKQKPETTHPDVCRPYIMYSVCRCMIIHLFFSVTYFLFFETEALPFCARKDALPYNITRHASPTVPHPSLVTFLECVE